MGNSIEERLSDLLLKKMVNYFEFSREDSLKINYGLTILLVNLSKALAIYLSAIIFGVFLETLLSHVTFCILRHNNYGFHFENSLICTLFGIFSFPISAVLLNWMNFRFSLLGLVIVSITFIAVTWRFAPSYTKYVGKDVGNHSRIKPLLTTINILILCVLSPFTDLTVFMVWGVFISNLLVLLNELKRRYRVGKSFKVE